MIRRVRHLTEGTPSPQYEGAAVGYNDTTAGLPAGSRLASPSSSTTPYSPQLQRLAQAAARLAQVGAPATTAPPYGQAPPPDSTSIFTPVPVQTAVACLPPPTRHFVQLDALGWWMKGDSLPALVTGSPSDTPLSEAGILGNPNTTVLFGNQTVNGSLRWGGRVVGGVWLDDFQTFAVEGHYYGFPTVTTRFSQTSDFTDGSFEDLILARPFFDTAPLVNQQEAMLLAFPGLVVPPVVVNVNGTITVEETSSFQSAGLGGRWGLFSYQSPFRAFLWGGYRFVNLNESLEIESTSSATIVPFPIPIPDDGTIQVFDRFTTSNVFNGGEIGLTGEYTRDRWSLTVLKRVALGNMNQKVKINGRTSALFEEYAASYEGGLLAQPSNIGTYTQNKFAWIPELDIKLGYQLFRCMRLTVGYNLTYVSNVVRPGGQIDTNVNTTQVAGLPLVGPPDPTVKFDQTSIWLQGFTTGIDMRF